MSNRKWWIAIAIVLCLCAFSLGAEPKPPEWVMQGCFTLQDVTDFLNKLPPERAIEAKVVAINSQRSFLGSLSTPYYVWYRR